MALFLGLLASAGRSWGAALACLVVLAVGAYYARVLGLGPGLTVLLIVSATVDRFTFPVGPLALRAEQVAALAAVVVLAVTLVRERRRDLLRPNLAELLLLAWLACNVLSTVLASPDRRLSAKILAVIAISSLGIFLPRRLLSLGGSLELVVRWLLVVFATEAGYSTIVYLLHAFGPTISVAVNPASAYLGAYGTLWEQNVLGAFSAAGLVAWAYLGPRRFRRAWIGVVACTGGLVESVTRAAWLVTVVVGGLGLVLRGQRRRLDMPMLAKAAAGGLAIIAATLLAARVGRYSYPAAVAPGGGGTGAPSQGYLSAILNRVDVLGRLNQLPLVWDDIHADAVLGRGTGAFEKLHQFKSVPEHIASLPLFVLDATGLLGLVVFTAFALVVFFRAFSEREDEIINGLGQVALVVALTNLATETMELMVGWLLLGLLLAAIAIRARAGDRPADREAGAGALPSPPLVPPAG